MVDYRLIFLPTFQLEQEIERRKELAFNFQQVLKQQKEIYVNDGKSREAHQVAFMATLRETARILKDFGQTRNKDEPDLEDEFDENLQHR